jgi:hypothetical protein
LATFYKNWVKFFFNFWSHWSVRNCPLTSLFILFHRSPDLILGTSGESSCAESEKESTPAKLQPSADSDEVAEISAIRESGQSRVPAVDDVVIIGEKKCQPASSTGDDASPKPNPRNENNKSDQVLISFFFLSRWRC